MRRVVRWLLIMSVLSVPFTLTHSIEDFSEGVPQERFGLALLPAALLLSLVYTAQLAGAILSAQDRRLGHLINAAVAVLWLAASVLDHLGEVIFMPNAQYRAGAISKLLEVGIMVIAAAWGPLASRAWRGAGASGGPRLRRRERR